MASLTPKNRHRNKPIKQLTRERLRPGEAISNLEWVENELRTRYRELDLGEIPALKEYAAIQRWKLDKILPALQAVKHEGEVTAHVVVKFNP